jgi:hypothetical protein
LLIVSFFGVLSNSKISFLSPFWSGCAQTDLPPKHPHLTQGAGMPIKTIKINILKKWTLPPQVYTFPLLSKPHSGEHHFCIPASSKKGY